MRRRLALGLPIAAVVLALMGCQPSSTQSLHPAAPLPASSAPSQQPPAAGHVGKAPAHRRTTTPSVGRYLSGQPLPDPRLTPGEVFSGVGPATFCVSGYTARARNVSTALKQAVFAEYHLSYAAHGGYEVDHLIPLELGGDNSISNLWPEKGSIPNPKDGLENQLHNMVCRGQLSTSTAQHAIASNWVTALHVYGSTGSVYERSSGTTSTPSKAPTKSAPPASSATGATAKCNDGTYSYAAHHQGACSHHGGVATWYR